MQTKSTFVTALLAVLGTTLSPGLSAVPCADPAFRAFDFWAGNWVVHTHSEPAEGRPQEQGASRLAGHNRVTIEENGCLLVEHWQSAGGGTGQSYNYYDPVRQQWHQLWVSNGAIIDYAGGLDARGAMHLKGEIRYQEGGTVAPFRGTWTPRADGSVLQKLEQYDADESVWQDWFTGIYRPAS